MRGAISQRWCIEFWTSSLFKSIKKTQNFLIQKFSPFLWFFYYSKTYNKYIDFRWWNILYVFGRYRKMKTNKKTKKEPTSMVFIYRLTEKKKVWNEKIEWWPQYVFFLLFILSNWNLQMKMMMMMMMVVQIIN